MIRLQSEQMALVCGENGRGLTVVDIRRGTRWQLDESTLIFGASHDLTTWKPLAPAAASARDNDALAVSYRADESDITMVYVLRDDHVEVRTPPPASDAVRAVSLPGAFEPEEEPLRLLLPIMQGMLWDGRGPSFETTRPEGSHTGFSMPFIGYLGERGGLLLTSETSDDQRWWLGKDDAGSFWAANVQMDSLGSMRYPRVVRIYATDPDIVAIAKRYRRWVQQCGRFRTWDEKLTERPGLERLFGALMTFVGYCRDDVDYVEGCRRLRNYGFDRAFVYPVRFNVYDPDLRMGGVPPVDIPSEALQAIKAIGYDVAPWSWLNEALDDGAETTRAMLRRDAGGEVMKHWAIDDQQWYHVCYSFIPDYQERALREDLAPITWDHFDVLSCVPPLECYALDHPHHLGRPLSRTEERSYIKRTLLADQERGLIVSSENFNDAYALELDMGSVKAWPQYGPWPFWPVPLTMLVYHDSMLYTWWEVHNYNNPWHGRTRGPGHFEYGGGRPRLQAALDALMGCPPDVFPFGAQYAYTGRGKETFLYKFRFDDPEVQLALRAALPVARLHRRIGKQEMVHFRILSDDGYVQESAFADGTRVIANFSRDTLGEVSGVTHTPQRGVEALLPESWVVAD
ncbi:MAG: hypothetical protein ACP5JG_13615 [Anaerolineae bacterium]